MLTDLEGNLLHFNALAKIFFRADLEDVVNTPFKDYLQNSLSLQHMINQSSPYQPFVSHSVCLKDLKDPVTLRVFKDVRRKYCLIVAESPHVTEEVLVNREERKWAERLQLMLFGISHELKTPLAVARGYTEALGDLEGGHLTTKAMEALEQISGILNNMTEAVRELRDEQDHIDLAESLEMYCKTMHYTEPTKRYIGTFVSDFEAAEGKIISMSKPRMYQILTNLFDNSIRATQGLETEAVIDIQTHECHKMHHSNCIVMEFSDNGCGMTEETAEKVFTPYFTTREADTGTGLGGYFVYQFVMDAGGTIEVESEEGVGTTFRIHLPYGDSNGSEQ